MSFFGGILSSLLERTPGILRRIQDDNQPIEILCQTLLSSRGDVSGMSLAQIILERYAAFDDDGKLAFFNLLADQMDVPADPAVAALQSYLDDPSAVNYAALTTVIEPPRLQLIRRMNQSQDATAKLVAMVR